MVPTLCTGELNDSNTHVVITLKQHVETAVWSTAVACINGIRTDFNLSLPSALTLLILALLTLRLFLCLHHLFYLFLFHCSLTDSILLHSFLVSWMAEAACCRLALSDWGVPADFLCSVLNLRLLGSCCTYIICCQSRVHRVHGNTGNSWIISSVWMTAHIWHLSSPQQILLVHF